MSFVINAQATLHHATNDLAGYLVANSLPGERFRWAEIRELCERRNLLVWGFSLTDLVDELVRRGFLEEVPDAPGPDDLPA